MLVNGKLFHQCVWKRHIENVCDFMQVSRCKRLTYPRLSRSSLWYVSGIYWHQYLSPHSKSYWFLYWWMNKKMNLRPRLYWERSWRNSWNSGWWVYRGLSRCCLLEYNSQWQRIRLWHHLISAIPQIPGQLKNNQPLFYLLSWVKQRGKSLILVFESRWLVVFSGLGWIGYKTRGGWSFWFGLTRIQSRYSLCLITITMSK